MIPKTIHYCWFGRGEKPELVKRCIDSWRKYCPDYQIKEWNEDNYDINKYWYTREAYDCKKWAFVTDVVRLEVVYNEGGIYLDTDVELFSGLNMLLDTGAVFVFESALNVASGLGFAAIQGHISIKEMLDCYRDRHFLTERGVDLEPCPASNTLALKKVYPQFCRNGQTQDFDDVKVLSIEEYSKIAKHHGSATWVDGIQSKKNKKYRDSCLKRFLRDPKKFAWIESWGGQKVLKVYSVLAYDLLEHGPWYFVRRKQLKRHVRLKK